MTVFGVRLPQLPARTWILLASLAVVAWLLREQLTAIARDVVEGRENEVAKYGVLLIGGFLVGWYWAGQYPTTPSGFVELAFSVVWEWATSLIPI